MVASEILIAGKKVRFHQISSSHLN